MILFLLLCLGVLLVMLLALLQTVSSVSRAVRAERAAFTRQISDLIPLLEGLVDVYAAARQAVRLPDDQQQP